MPLQVRAPYSLCEELYCDGECLAKCNVANVLDPRNTNWQVRRFFRRLVCMPPLSATTATTTTTTTTTERVKYPEGVETHTLMGKPG